MIRLHHRSLFTLEEVQANPAHREQPHSREDCCVVDVPGHSEGGSGHDVVGQHEVDDHEDGSLQEDGVFDEEQQELEAEDVVDDLGQHKGQLLYRSFDRPVIPEFAVVLPDLQPHLLDFGGWLFVVEGFEDADDVGAAVWTLDLFVIFLSVDLEDAICAEGVPAGHSNPKIFGLDEADAALLIIQLVGMR